MTTKQISKDLFNKLQDMFEEAADRGPDALQSHLKDVAFSLGAQAAVGSEPEELPQVVSDLVTEFGRGIQAILYEITGNESKFDVSVYAVNSSRH